MELFTFKKKLWIQSGLFKFEGPKIKYTANFKEKNILKYIYIYNIFDVVAACFKHKIVLAILEIWQIC